MASIAPRYVRCWSAPAAGSTSPLRRARPSGRAIVNRRLPGGGRPDFFLLSQFAAQPACGQQCPLDVFVAGTLFKEDNYFAVRALPGVAGLYPFGPVAKRGFAPGAMNLNGFIHVPAFNEA